MNKIIASLFLLIAISCMSQISIAELSGTTKYKNTVTNDSVSIAAKEDDEVFIKEYTYNASDDDSKNSSRKKAIQQIKILLSEEVGTHIQSYLEIDKTVRNGVSYEDVKQEINNLTVGITKLKVLDENWNGKKYYIKASVAINTDRTMSLLLEAIKSKSSEKDIKRLNKILAEQKAVIKSSNIKIQEMNRKLIGQEITNEARNNELVRLKRLQVSAKKKEQQYNRQISTEQKELDDMKRRIAATQIRIKKQKNKACLLIPKMTKYEVKSIIGEPDKIERHTGSWYYGSVMVMFHNSTELTIAIIGCK